MSTLLMVGVPHLDAPDPEGTRMSILTPAPARNRAPAAASWRGAVAIAVVAAVTAALAGLVLLSAMLTAPRVAVAGAGETVEVSGLSLRLETAGWITHDTSSMAGMPASAMPDMPAAGQNRLRVHVVVRNETGSAEVVDRGDFRLRFADGRSLRPGRATLPARTDLAPGQVLGGDFYFEVPAGQDDFSLTLTRGKQAAWLPLPLGGPAPDHGHSSERSSR